MNPVEKSILREHYKLRKLAKIWRAIARRRVTPQYLFGYAFHARDDDRAKPGEARARMAALRREIINYHTRDDD